MGQPQVVIIAGPNGAGKSTCAATYLADGMTYVNADEIAKGLPECPSSSADIQAGRLALEAMEAFEGAGRSFAMETTLATQSLARRLIRLRDSGYAVNLVFIYCPSPEFSIARVAARVLAGGHDIPQDTIRRRYHAGLRNFFKLYQPIADRWDVLDNSDFEGPRAIASGGRGRETKVYDVERWRRIREGGVDEPE